MTRLSEAGVQLGLHSEGVSRTIFTASRLPAKKKPTIEDCAVESPHTGGRLARRVAGFSLFRGRYKDLLTNISQSCLINSSAAAGYEPTAKFFNKITIAHDKGKLAARQGRKAVSLRRRGTSVRSFAKTVWLPKAILRVPRIRYYRGRKVKALSVADPNALALEASRRSTSTRASQRIPAGITRLLKPLSYDL